MGVFSEDKKIELAVGNSYLIEFVDEDGETFINEEKIIAISPSKKYVRLEDKEEAIWKEIEELKILEKL